MKKLSILFFVGLLISSPVFSNDIVLNEDLALKEAKEQVGVPQGKMYQEIDLQMTQPAKVIQIDFEPKLKQHSKLKMDKIKIENTVPSRVIINMD